MTPDDDRFEEECLAELLARALPPGPDPDPARLAASRAASLATFADAPPTSPRRTKPMTHLLRLAAGLIAASVVVSAATREPRPDPDPVGAAFAQLTAGGAHFRLTDGERARDAYVQFLDNVRIEDDAERYTLLQSRGGDAYAVDEGANRYARLDPAERDRLRGLFPPWDTRRLSVVGSSPCAGGTTYALDPPAEVDLDAAGKFVELRRYALNNGARQLVATLTLLQNPAPMPDDKFALKPTLSEDGRVGKVSDVQGLASIKPLNAARFTPLRPNTLVLPGDWVRVDPRGANAATVRLLPEATLIVGPGGLVEVTKPDRLRLIQGEIEVTPAKGTPVELLGPGDAKLTLTERGFYRLVGDKLARAAADPVWLRSLKGASANESLGSLVAQVDGRAVSLSVGVHKVTVEVRDQIARTTIEETFVNHTASQLEGVFHFPLPQDASIAGFAMWIGNEKVEADVVEKQRAREIFETILREKRDPGLLEWAGGNLFKARVFPIFAHSEKRVSITYTQVLPAVGNKVRYSYALQSEMLRLNPLRELSVTFTATSALPMKSLTSPTHTCRSSFAGTSGRLEFAAQEYTPTRDFEAVIELADAAPAVTLVPHRRGADGYFLLQVTPPAPQATGRGLVAGDAPLSLVLWCDTSASIDAAQRKTQSALAAALLTALTPRDTFNLAVTDVATLFAFPRSVPATPDNINTARDYLARRASLGWSDLEGGLKAVLAQAAPGAQVVYLGDGIAGTVAADPQGAAVRLEESYKLAAKPVTVHAVALGSTFESGVLAKLASLGGGSSRRVNGEQGPVQIALEILGEITRPPVRNVRVAFSGLKTAKVYPEVLPNLVPGTQQILLGRYLPEGVDQTGEVVVTGTRDGREVRFAAPVTLKDAEAGNSFLPRLWARLHLDKLLEGPQTSATKDDVVGLSEEFHIMTPYTSFLVLESDADRARFAVKRRFQMRDGEQFFADGRDKAAYALQREQMKQAGLWRAGLRRQVLNRLANLDRPQALPQSRGRGESEFGLHLSDSSFAENQFFFKADFGEAGREGKGGSVNGPATWAAEPRELNKVSMPESPTNQVLEERQQLEDKASDRPAAGGEVMLRRAGEKSEREADFFKDGNLGLAAELPSLATRDAGLNESLADGLSYAYRDGDAADGFSGLALSAGLSGGRPGGFGGGRMGRSASRGESYGFGGGFYGRSRQPQPAQPIDALFPAVPPAPSGAAPKSPWPQDATDLAALVYRRPSLATLPGGLTITRAAESVAPRQATTRQTATELIAPKHWATRHESDAGATAIDGCDGAARFSVNAAFGLARRRDAKPSDLSHPPVNGFDATMTPLWEQYAGIAKVEAGPVLVVTSPDGRFVVRVGIDPVKRVVTRTEASYEGAPATTVVTYADFVPARGQWWATTIETATGGKVQSRVKQTVAETPDAEFAKAYDALTAPLAKAVVQRVPAPTFAAAKKALAEGKATTDDRFTLLRRALAFQRYAEATAELDAIDKLEAGKPGLAWLQIALQMTGRRNEEARQRMIAAAPVVLSLPTPGDRIALAQWLAGQAASVLSTPEQRELRDKLAAPFDALPADHPARRDWSQQSYYALANSGLGVEAFAYLRATVAADPTNFYLRHLFIRLSYDRGERDAAYAMLREQIAHKGAWDAHELDQLYANLAEYQEREGKLPEKLDTLAAWLAFSPESEAAAGQLLSALVRTDAEPRADALAGQWLAEAKVAKPSEAQAFKARAALRYMLGQAEYLNSDRLDPKWVAVLADAARFFFGQGHRYSLLETVTTNGLFHQTDAGRALLADLLARVVAEAGTSPIERLQQDLEWVARVPVAADAATWAKLAAAARARWAAIADDDAKHAFGRRVAGLLSGRLGMGEAVQFTRERVQSGPAKYRRQYQAELFGELLALPWADARLTEAYELVPVFLTDAEGKPAPAVEAIGRLMRLSDWAVQARSALLQAEIKNPERLTRPELKAKRDEATRQARGEAIDRLTKFEATAPAALKPWARLERLTLQARHDADPNAVAAEVFTLLGAAPLAAPGEDDEVTADQALSLALQARAVNLAMHAATRRAATPATVARLRQFLDAGIATRPQDDAWKQLKYELLVALDLPGDLEAALTAWAKAGDPAAQWRTALGYLFAELGRIKEAIAVFEGIREIDADASGRSMALARLYMAVDDKARHDAARADAYRQLDENTLAGLLQAKYQPWQPRQGVALPTELDADTLPILRALVEKLANVEGYFHIVQRFYQASKDFRIPETVADAALGQSAGKVYAIVGRMQSLLNDIRDEAAADKLAERIEALRARAKTPTDLRALDLLAMQVHRRAAEVRNQPGPHAELALAAFRRAFERPWAEGERLLMARLLRDFSVISPEALGAEQLRQLKALADAAPKATLERLSVAECYAAALRDRGKTVEAIGALTPALADYVAATKGAFTAESLAAAQLLAALHESRNDCAEAERLWLGWRAAAANDQVRAAVTESLDQCYTNALRRDAGVTLGKGEALYAALLGRLNERLRDPEANARQQALGAFQQLFGTAEAKKFPRLKADVLVLANETFPRLVKPWEQNYVSYVQTVAGVVRHHAGPHAAVEFVVGRVEALPAWLRHADRAGWGAFASSLASWRDESPGLPPALEARLLKLVVAELTEDLRSRRQRNREMYDRRYGRYWAAKEAEFAAAAEAVLAESKDSVEAQLYAAEYLFHGVNRAGRAIDVLYALHRAKRLDRVGRFVLVDYLGVANRSEEVVAVAVPLLDETPDDASLRFRLMTAYHRLGRPAEARELFGRGVARRKESGRWDIAWMALFAGAAQDCELHKEAADVYAELIPNAQRAAGSPNAALTEYYRRHALSLSALGRHAEAVDAAAGAVVAWGGDLGRRRDVVVTLNATVARVPDLDALAAHTDAQTAATGLVNPVLRKSLGEAYRARQNYGPAIAQLELALEAQPNDPETFAALIDCYDRQNRRPEALDRILKSLDLSRRDPPRYDDLGRRYESAGDAASAERAFTSMVEVTRGESEGQALLARVRQRQGRWAEAPAHWEQVNAVRSLEPEGLIGLAEAQLHLKQYDAARATIQKLRAGTWPAHAANVPGKLRELEARLPK